MSRERSTTQTPDSRSYMLQPSDVPVVVIRKAFPGLQVRLLADRDAGVVVWESYILDDSGTVVADGPVIKMEMEHLMNLEALIELLLEARDALSPRRRLDLARLEEPEDVVPSSIQKVE